MSQKHHPLNTAFVLGNGRSRLNVNASDLLERGTVYGCNALYREIEPHFLIAVDVKMVNEIVSSGYHRTHSVWTNPNKGISTKQGLNFFDPHKGWSSGPTALWHACSRGHKIVYILGFDYQGDNGKFNNVYADTFNYKKSTDAATYFGNWMNQTERVIQEFNQVKFYRVIQPGSFIPEKLQKAIPNLQHITYENFKKEFNLDQNDQKNVV